MSEKEHQKLKVIFSKIVGLTLEGIWEKSKSRLDSENPTWFDLFKIPSISVSDFMVYITNKQCCITLRSIVLCLNYIDKIHSRDEIKVTLSKHNVHILVLVAMVVANKFYDEEYESNETWAENWKIELKQLNKWEKEFLNIINFDLNLDAKEFLGYTNLILKSAIKFEMTDMDTAQKVYNILYQSSYIECCDGNDSDS